MRHERWEDRGAWLRPENLLKMAEPKESWQLAASAVAAGVLLLFVATWIPDFAPRERPAPAANSTTGCFAAYAATRAILGDAAPAFTTTTSYPVTAVADATHLTIEGNISRSGSEDASMRVFSGDHDIPIERAFSKLKPENGLAAVQASVPSICVTDQAYYDTAKGLLYLCVMDTWKQQPILESGGSGSSSRITIHK